VPRSVSERLTGRLGIRPDLGFRPTEGRLEQNLAKVRVAGSNPVVRSTKARPGQPQHWRSERASAVLQVMTRRAPHVPHQAQSGCPAGCHHHRWCVARSDLRGSPRSPAHPASLRADRSGRPEDSNDPCAPSTPADWRQSRPPTCCPCAADRGNEGRHGPRPPSPPHPIDVEQFLAAAASALASYGQREARAARAELAHAERLYTGVFLDEDPYEDWTTPLRDESRTTYISIVRALAALAEASGDLDDALRYHRRVLERDAWDEGAHLALVSLLEQAGRHGEARRCYRVYVSRMEEIRVRVAPFPSS